MKLLFICTEFPYPPVHGGRADTWQRLRAFVESGTQIQLLCWYSNRRGGKPSNDQIAVVEALVDSLIVLPVNLGIPDLAWRFLNLWRWPSLASARMPRGNSWGQLLEKIASFGPGAIWVDGLWPGAFAKRLSTAIGRPYFYRSHNIEHRYMARQAAIANSLPYRARLLLMLIGLERFEREIVLGAAEVFDISVDDLAFWQARGLRAGRWLPPIVPARDVPAAGTGAEFDIAFLGNLHTPNNVEAVKWLLAEVWPLLRAKRPEASALIAGFAPNDEVCALVASSPGVRLIGDPPDVWPLYASARVLVNPARSGSGVNIKSVEMLQLNVPIVSTPVGVGGLPEQIRAQFVVAGEASTFASGINDALNGLIVVDLEARKRARLTFSPQAIDEVIEAMRAQVAV
jgi:polysaccharide biosynthesis protein PslH